MRRRERYRNTVWLGELGGDQAARVCRLPDGTVGSLNDSLLKLVRDFGYLVEFERDVDTYHLRCFPFQDGKEVWAPPLALSYIGTNLANMSATAVMEAGILASGEEEYTLSVPESQRWVA